MSASGADPAAPRIPRADATWSGHVAAVIVGALVATSVSACGGSSKQNDAGPPPSPPVKSQTVLVPFQLTSVYKLEQDGDGDFTATASFYDATRTWDLFGAGGGVELTGGDAVYCDGLPLDTKTTTQVGGLVGVEYSRTIPKGKTAYRFELRRPEYDETLYVDVAVPEPFQIVTGPFAVTLASGSMNLAWQPITTQGATMTIIAVHKTGTCGYAVITDETVIRDALPDTGSVSLTPTDFATPQNNAACVDDIRVERRLAQQSGGHTTVGGFDVSGAADIRIGLVHRETTSVTVTP